MEGFIVLIIFGLYLTISIGSLLIAIKKVENNRTIGDFNRLDDETLLHVISTLGGVGSGEAFKSAMKTDGRKIFENHVNFEYHVFFETGKLSEYVRKHFLNVLNGKEPLLVEDYAILVA